MKRPCTTCKAAKKYEYSSKIRYEPCNFCWRGCEKLKKYEAYKESRRMYKCGKPINSMIEFMEYIKGNRYIFWNGKVYHVEMIKSWQYRLIENMINRNQFYEAIKKDDKEKEILLPLMNVPIPCFDLSDPVKLTYVGNLEENN